MLNLNKKPSLLVPFFWSLALALTLIAGWLVEWVWQPGDMRAFSLGRMTGVISVAVITTSLLLASYLERHGWTGLPSDWRERLTIQFGHDFTRDEHGCWSLEFLRMEIDRNHERGTGAFRLSILGLRLIVGVLVNREQFEAYTESRKNFVKEGMEKAKAQMIEMMRSVADPLGMMVEEVGPPVEEGEVTAIPVGIRRKTDDDDKVH